ncbi:unnamed protein product [Phytomonas sp. EM1]|nr:unnamed protein product [Phytomonas sp. EM1]|eukprot:CCW61066.1 unnamed protein product [Phytomonas sp. isolate EM1]
MSERVRVVVRVRPFIESDPDDADLAIVTVNPTHVSVGGNRVFAVDRVYGMEDSTLDIFDDTVRKIVDDFLNGFHATVLAYGQTGTGKTFTMSGLMPLILRYIVEKGFHGATRELSFQFIEVYGDVLRDLLTEDPVNDGNEIQLFDGGGPSEMGRDCVVIGARRATAEDLSGIEKIIQYGTQLRATAATNIHEHSSRSHSIFTIYNHHHGGNKLHLVDLAGSERNKKTLNVGQRFKESIAINSGLLALGNVIRALVRNSHQGGGDPAGHVPYRSSKLTRLLQNALGGNGKTLFLGCVAPGGNNRDETLRTLQYCALAVRVLNTPLPQYRELHDAQMRPFRSKPPNPQAKRDDGKAGGPDGVGFSLATETGDVHTELEMYRQFCLEQEGEIESLQQQLRAAEDRARVFEDELRNDQVIFTRQIAEMERVLAENRELRQRLAILESNQTALPSVEKPAGEGWSGSAPPTNPQKDPSRALENFEAGETSLRRGNMKCDNPVEEGNPPSNRIPPSFSSQPANGVAGSRDEQLWSLTKEALFYQTNNAELRNQLGSVMARLEAQQRESALLRLELQEIHELLHPQKKQ